ncbi:hypothetical protein N2152v2_011120 [Parachlorella kessleri]
MPARTAGLAAIVALLSILVTHQLSTRGLDSITDLSRPPPLPIFKAGWLLVNSAPRWYSHLLPPQLHTLQVASAFLLSKAVYAVTRLGVPDQLWDPVTQQPVELSVQQLAEQVGANPDRLHRVMRALAGVGIFRQLKGGRFTNNAASGVLRKDHPNTIHHPVLALGGFSFWGLAKLSESMAEGVEQAPFELQTGGTPFWEFLQQPGNAQLQEEFDRSMVEASRLSNPGLLQFYPWQRHAGQTVVDVGGGLGGFLSQLLTTQGNLSGVLFDSPAVIERAKQDWQRNHPDLGSRVQFAAGSFFEGVPPGNVFFLRQGHPEERADLWYILHDWDDGGALKILKVIRRACSDEATLLIADTVLPGPDELLGPIQALFDLQMLGTVSGRERSRQQFQTLLEAAGFELARVWDTRGLFIVAARPMRAVHGKGVEQAAQS